MSNPNWLAADDWAWVQATVPVACADVLPVRVGPDGSVAAVGLIHRETPHQGRRWCMVGGRMWRDESFAEAASRQLRETLGDTVRFDPPGPDAQPDHVAQYFTTGRGVGLVDPRQHAVTVVFVVAVAGEVTAGGEALAFQWHDPMRLPAVDQWGFGQDRIADACLRRRGVAIDFVA